MMTAWWSLRSQWLRLTALTLGSYVFYGWWDWRFLPLMLASTTVDYVAGQRISRSEDARSRRLWLIGSLSFNLAVLGIFKYYHFFASSITAIGKSSGLMLPLMHLVLPIGISFYTFNSMSYTIDIYRGVVRPARSVLHFSAFVAMFPHLICGPIVRYSDVEDQLNTLKLKLGSSEAAKAITFFVLGLAKKLIIADHLARPVALFFDSGAARGVLPAWVAVLAYTFQLYFDFSGYSDMAVGLAHLLGFQFPQNFNSPYKATSIADFWRRWHISLSTWLRDYLFIPLGGSRHSLARTVFNLTVTMFLGGLWHGAKWTFVLWGLYHGVLLASHAVLRRHPALRLPAWGGRVITFLAVALGWTLFRASSVPFAIGVAGQLFGAQGLGAWTATPAETIVLIVAAIIAFTLPNTWEIRVPPTREYAYAFASLLICAVLMIGSESPFLYFQF